MTEPQDPQSSLPPYPGLSATPAGIPSYQPGFPPQVDPNVRPGTVAAAAWISIGLSVLGLLASLGLLAATSRAVNYVIDHPEQFDVQSSDLPAATDLRSAMSGIAIIFMIGSAVAILAAFASLKRQGWARILLVAMSVLTAIVAIPFSLVLVGLPWLAGSITVIVMLFTNRANLWFRGSGGQ